MPAQDMSHFLAFTFPSVLLVCVLLTLPQSDIATISGHITDPSGHVLWGAPVNVTNLETGIGVWNLTNSDGIYVAGDSHPRPHRMVVVKEGFLKIGLNDLIGNPQDALDRKLTMQIGSVHESIAVTAGSDEYNLSPAVSTVVDMQFVQNVLRKGRLFNRGLTISLNPLTNIGRCLCATGGCSHE